MIPKNRTLEGKNWTLGGGGGQKSSKIVGHHLCTFPKVYDVQFWRHFHGLAQQAPSNIGSELTHTARSRKFERRLQFMHDISRKMN